MNITDIYLITQVDSNTGELSILAGSTDYDLMVQEFDLVSKLNNYDSGVKFITMRIPEIIFTGDYEIIDLTEQAAEAF